jgi:hypothetical protein
MLALTLAGSMVAAACGSDSGENSTFDAGGGGDGSLDGTTDGGASGDAFSESGFSLDSAAHDGETDGPEALDVEPSTLQTITVPLGQTMPTVTFTATYGGHAINAGWGVDRGDLASVGAGPSSSATVTPTGTTGGLVTLTAGLNGQTLTRQILIKLTSSQNGPTAGESGQIPTTVGQLTTGGGVGGVGGEGLGTTVTDTATQTALATPANNGIAQNLTYL